MITTAKLGLASEDRVLGAVCADETTGEVETFRS
jgi:hypothetical protein